MSRFTNWLLGVKYKLNIHNLADMTGGFTGEDSAGNTKQCAVSKAKIDKDGNVIFKPTKETNLKDFEKAVGQKGEIEVSGRNGVLEKESNGKGIIILLCVAAGIAGAVFLWKGFADRDAQIEDLKAKLENCGNEKESLEGQRATAQQAADDESQKLSDCEDENAILLDSIGKLNTRIDTLNFANDSLQKGWYKCRGLDENGNRIVRHNKPNNKPKEDEKSPVKMEIIYGKYDCFKYMTSGDYVGAKQK